MKRFLPALLALLLVLPAAASARALDAGSLARVPWEERASLALENGFVCVSGEETVNLPLLEGWIGSYQAGEPASVTIMTYAHPSPLVYTLTGDGGSEYTVAWHASDGRQGEYRARGVHARATDYVFGGTFPQGFKGPLSVPRAPLTEEPGAAVPEGAIPERGAVSLAARAETRMREYLNRWQGAANSILLEDPRAAGEAAGDFRVSGTVALAGLPCYLVTNAAPENWDGVTYAVSADGSLLFLQDLGFGGWTRLWDGGETLLLPAEAQWTRASV